MCTRPLTVFESRDYHPTHFIHFSLQGQTEPETLIWVTDSLLARRDNYLTGTALTAGASSPPLPPPWLLSVGAGALARGTAAV